MGFAASQPAPKKSLGQHFLTNPEICRRIASLLCPQMEDQILEIGPGPGALTRALAALPHKRLLLVEKDAWWAKERAIGGNAEILHMDIMCFDWRNLAARGRWKLVGNLPYNIASPLIWDILEKCRAWERAVFMVQKEVAERICGQCGTKAYGALSVWAKCHAQTRLEFTLAPGAFKPPPKVDSAVVSFLPLNEPPRFPNMLRQLLHICFQQRRKQIGGILRKRADPAFAMALTACDIDPQARPEQLPWQKFLQMSQWLGEKKY